MTERVDPDSQSSAARSGDFNSDSKRVEFSQGESCARLEALFTGNVVGAFSLALTDKIDRAVTKASGLNRSACWAIVTIGTEPNSSIDTLRRMLDLEHSSMVRLVAKLVDQKLVTKHRGTGDDNRVVCVALTPAGMDVFRKIAEARHTVLESLTSGLTKAETAYLKRIVEKVMVQIVDPGDDQHYVCRLCDPDVCDQRLCPVNRAYPDLYELPDHLRSVASN